MRNHVQYPYDKARLLRAFWICMICLKWHPTQADAFSCTWTDPISGKFFDLRSLKKPEGQSWIVPAGEVLYSTNVVRVVYGAAYNVYAATNTRFLLASSVAN